MRTRSVRQIRNDLVEAVQQYAKAFGNAQWTNGYRAASPTDEASLYGREMLEWKWAGEREKRFAMCLAAYTRAVKRAATKLRDAKRAAATVGAKRKK